MTRDDVLRFLQESQPLPPDGAVTREQLAELDAARKFVADHPADDLVALLLGVFGEGSGFGVYQLIEGSLASSNREAVVRSLDEKLQNGPRSVRYWCAQIAAAYPDERLATSLAALLDPMDRDLRYAAVVALEALGTTAALAILRRWLPNETDGEIKTIIEDVAS